MKPRLAAPVSDKPIRARLDFASAGTPYRIGEDAAFLIKACEVEWALARIAELEKKNSQLRQALRGLFKSNSLPYAQWSSEMHAADIALEDKISSEGMR